MTVELQAETPKTELALSAVNELLPDDAGTVPSIEAELERIEAGASPDRLIEYIWPTRAQALAQFIDLYMGGLSESEKRLMDGNR